VPNFVCGRVDRGRKMPPLTKFNRNAKVQSKGDEAKVQASYRKNAGLTTKLKGGSN